MANWTTKPKKSKKKDTTAKILMNALRPLAACPYKLKLQYDTKVTAVEVPYQRINIV